VEKVNVAAELAAIREHFRPKVVAKLNGQEVKLAKTLGEFIWHHHDDADEMFLVVKGLLRLEFRDRTITLGPGELLVVPKGVEHRPVAVEETEIMLFEPAGVRNTGNVDHPELTAR
jgi:mannose-6-phosphate isomerase-like protein (cupin superfamily)